MSRGEPRMRGSAVASSVFLAWRTLILVEDGWSERGGLAHVSRKNPSPTGKKEALGFVLGLLARRNLVDRVVEACHGNLPSNKEQLSLARLAVHLLLWQSHRGGQRKELEALRRVCPDYYRTELERLAGYVLANEGPSEFVRSAHNEDRV